MKAFIQKKVKIDPEKNSGRLKVGKLCTLLDQHPYKDKILKNFDIENIKNEFIFIDNIDDVFHKIKAINKDYKRFHILAYTKDINVFEDSFNGSEEEEKKVFFQFDQYVEVDEVKSDLKACAIYNSKNTFFDEYDMTKYANSLYQNNLARLANLNLKFFKELAQSDSEYNKYRSYRLVQFENDLFLRGITSEKYNEYGVDFAFAISMLILHNAMKQKGTEYSIKEASLNESKLEMIITEKELKDAGAFGKVSAAIKVSTNDLGQGSLNFSSIINVGPSIHQSFPLFPKPTKFHSGKMIITHTVKPENVFETLKGIDEILETSDEFIKELEEVKSIKNPEELRFKILMKIENPRSSLKGIKELSDIFNRKIDNEISNFSKLLEMCNKSEKLDLQFELKDRLRYIISDTILYGNRS